MFTDVIDSNLNGDEKTFIGLLHEKGTIQLDLFWPLFDQINGLSEALSKQEDVSKVIVQKIIKLQSIIMSYMTYHFDTNDEFCISNIDKFDYQSFIERIKVLFENFGNRKIPESLFDDDLRK
ncbi:MAG: hypothetical protein HRU19_29140 [Pseudobacteriovorax sp.]|nr:hypothetical protein [Pseudobacteriovorax sp.]